MRLPAFSFVLAVFVLVLGICHAFTPTLPPTSVRPASLVQATSVLQMVKKKRRRRKEAPSSPSPSVGGDNDLPDFDLSEDDVEINAPAKPTKSVDPDAITDAMMGTQKPLRSVKELISDRSLEKAFQFDEPEDALPDLPDLKNPQAIGKKRARQEARRAAATAEEDETSIVDTISGALESLPFLKSDRESSSLKLVENATWLGIFLLVAWEIYINSPFFERAAPLAPIVYDFFM